MRSIARLLVALALLVGASAAIAQVPGRVSPLPGLTGLGSNALPGLISPVVGNGRSVKVAMLTAGTGTWSVPADAIGPCVIYAWGPGGTGGVGTQLTNSGGGGGSGALGVHTSKVLLPGSLVPYVVGTVGTSTTILGGTAPSGGSGTTAVTAGAAAAIATGFDINIAGANGGAGKNNGGVQNGNAGDDGTNNTGSGAQFIASTGINSSPGGGGGGAPSPTSGPVGGGGGTGGQADGATPLLRTGEPGKLPGGGGGGGAAVQTTGVSAPGAGANGLILVFYASSLP